MKHVVIINQSLPPFFSELAEALAKRGWRVTVMAGGKHTFENPHITVFPGPVYVRTSLRARFVSWMRFLWFLFTRLRQVECPAVFLYTTNPPFTAWLLACCQPKQAALVGYVLDIYPDVIAPRLRRNHLGWLVTLWHRVNRMAYRRSHSLITMGEVMAQTLRQDTPDLPTVIPLCFTISTSDLPKRQVNRFRSQHGWQDKLVVLYAGNLGLSHRLDSLIAAAACLQGDSDKVQFVIIGDGEAKAQLQQQATHMGNRVHFLPYQPVEALAETLSAADIAVVSVERGLAHTLMPSKCYNAMAAGSAILALAEGDCDLSRLVASANCGISVPPDDTAALVAYLRDAMSASNTVAEQGQRAQQYALANFSRHQMTDRIETHLKTVWEGLQAAA